MDAFYAKMAEILEVDVVSPTDKFREFENWDSLTILSVIAMLDANYRINLSAKDIQQLVTVGELSEKLKASRNR